MEVLGQVAAFVANGHLPHRTKTTGWAGSRPVTGMVSAPRTREHTARQTTEGQVTHPTRACSAARVRTFRR